MKPIHVVTIEPPATELRSQRRASFASPGARKNRYTLPPVLASGSPIGYRARIPFSRAEAEEIMPLLSLQRPTGFADPQSIDEQSLFEECSLGILSSRQSTNFRGFRQVSFGPKDSRTIRTLLAELEGLESSALEGASHTHLVLACPYRNPFTMLLTLVGHSALTSPFTVLNRIIQKRTRFTDDIPTIGYLPHLHIGILAESMERAAVVASEGRRRAHGLMRPFCGEFKARNRAVIRKLEALCGLSIRERIGGWGLALAVQVGQALPDEAIPLSSQTARRLGANLLSFRSERVQPGVNNEDKAPPAYQLRQNMDVPDELTVMAGRAAYNSFAYWTGLDRERAKDVLLLERIDVLTPGGKARLRSIRGSNHAITDRLIREMPVWADLPVGRAFSRNAERGRKAFALVGQRIYIGGLSREEIESEGLDWLSCVRAVGAAASRSALFCELMGVTELPDDCDLLAGICLMAGPVNQNDIGKTYYGMPDLLAHDFGHRDPTSLLVWTLKAKTVADPIGNEEQLLNKKRKGALVDLRPAPHEVIQIAQAHTRTPMRSVDGQTSRERAYVDHENLVTDPQGVHIEGNQGEAWVHGSEQVWSE